MRSFIRALLLSVTVLCAGPVAAQDLSQSSVKALSAKLDAAAARRDVDTILGHIADYAVISGTVNAQGQTQSFRMGKSQYAQVLRMAWGAASSYTYKRSNEKILIEGSQATITADVAETMVIEGQQMSTRSRERATVELVDGKLLLTKIFAAQVQ